jgi:hypothetical protein
MPEETMLRVGTIWDGAPVDRGVKQSSEIVEAATKKMEADFAALGAKQAELENKTIILAQGYQRLKAAKAPIEDLDRVKAAYNKTNEEALAIEDQLVIKQIVGVQASDLAAAAVRKEAEELRKLRSEKMEAKHAAMMLGHETGVVLPRHVISFLSSMGPVAGIMASAFAPIMVAGLVIALGEKVPEAIEKAINKLRGWDEEAKKAFEQETEWAAHFQQKIIEMSLKVKEARETAGLSGIVKSEVEKKSVEEQRATYEKMLGQWEINLKQNKEGLKDVEMSWGKVKDAVAGTDKGIAYLNPAIGAVKTSVKLVGDVGARVWSGEEIDKYKEKIKIAEQQVKSYKEQILGLREKIPMLTIGESVQRKKDMEAMTSAKIEATEKVEKAVLATQRKQADEDFKLHYITFEDKLALDKKFADEELKITTDTLAKKKALAVKEATTGTPAGPKLAGFAVDEADAKIKHDQAITALGVSAVEERIKQEKEYILQEAAITKERNDHEEALARAHIDSQKTYGLQLISGQEAATKRAYSTHRIQADEEARQLQDEEKSKYDTEHIALENELTLARGGGREKEADVIKLQGEMLKLEMEHIEKMAAIHAEGDQKVQADVIERSNEELSIIQRTANRVLSVDLTNANSRLKMHQVSLSEWGKEENKAINDWYTMQAAGITKQLKLLESYGLQETKEYRALQHQLITLDDERKKKLADTDRAITERYQQMVNKISGTFTSGFDQWLSGHESFGKAMMGLYNQMATSIINNLIQMGIQMVATSALERAEGKKNVLVDAGGTAATAFHKVMKALPFPANVIVAPLAAAGAFAAVAAFGSFAKGGIADEDMSAQIHKKEMVLPSDLSTGLQGMIRNNLALSTPGGSPSANVNYAPTIIGDKAFINKALTAHPTLVSDHVNREMRKGTIKAGKSSLVGYHL